MSISKQIIIKNKRINKNAIILSLLSAFLILIATALIANLQSNNNDDMNNILEDLLPFTLLLLLISIFVIFYKYRTKPYLLEIINNKLILYDLKTRLPVSETLTAKSKIEYGYYTYYSGALVRMPIITFQFSDNLIFRCSYKSKPTKPVIMYWEGDDIHKREYKLSVDFKNPDYFIDVLSFTQLAETLIPDHKLISYKYTI